MASQAAVHLMMLPITISIFYATAEGNTTIAVGPVDYLSTTTK
jgi:hypothetical protein